jgi:hypothetical protein
VPSRLLAALGLSLALTLVVRLDPIVFGAAVAFMFPVAAGWRATSI